MFRLVLISVNNPTMLGIYISDSLIMQLLESKQYKNMQQHIKHTIYQQENQDSKKILQKTDTLHTIEDSIILSQSINQDFLHTAQALHRHDNNSTQDSKLDSTSYSLLFSLMLDGKTSQTLPILFYSILQNNQNPFDFSHAINECILQECQISPLLFLLYQDSRLFVPQISTMLDSVFSPLLESHKEIFNTDFLQYNEIKHYNPLFSLQEALQILSAFHDIHGIYYARGVGSLSAIKLTHIFLHTLSLSLNIPLYATNSFYFNGYNEIKAFGNMSFFYYGDKHGDKGAMLTDSNVCDFVRLQKSIAPHTSFTLPHKLLCADFNESCTPLYITPAL